jgi:AAA domain
MKILILTLTLKTFRSHQETVLDLDRFNFVRGPNGCGKSSIQMALEYLFTGQCEMTDAAGRGAEALIRIGAKELEVSATLENGESVCDEGRRDHTFSSSMESVFRWMLPKERRKMLTSLLVRKLDQANVLAAGEEPTPAALPRGVKFIELSDPRVQAYERVDGRAFARPSETIAHAVHAAHRD